MRERRTAFWKMLLLLRGADFARSITYCIAPCSKIDFILGGYTVCITAGHDMKNLGTFVADVGISGVRRVPGSVAGVF